MVYKAEDIDLHRFVALKFLPEDIAKESPGDYFIFNAQTQEVVARLHNRSEPTKDVLEVQDSRLKRADP